jgi:hypothetical protein
MRYVYAFSLLMAVGCAKESPSKETPSADTEAKVSTTPQGTSDASACTMVVAVTGMS